MVLQSYPGNAENDGGVSGTVLVVTYYGFNEPIGYACRALNARFNWTVVDFPLFRYKCDANDKTPDYLSMLCEAVVRSRADCVLLWHHGLDDSEIKQVKSTVPPRTKFVIYNWDDPYSWRDAGSHVPRLAPFLDGALTCCTGSVERYRHASRSAAATPALCAAFRYCLPGFAEEMAQRARSEHAGPDRFVCDVVFMCTNLYESKERYPHQRVNRAELCTRLYELHCSKEIVFHIYGPEFLAQRFPESYRGYLQYPQQYAVMRTAKLVLTTHVVGDMSEGHYANERTCVALGLGCVLLSDLRPYFERSQADGDAADGDDGADWCGDDNAFPPFVLDSGSTVDSAVQRCLAFLQQSNESAEEARELAHRVATRHLSWHKWAETVDSVLRVCAQSAASDTESDQDSAHQKAHDTLARAIRAHSVAGFENCLEPAGGTGAHSAAAMSLHSGPLMSGHWEGDNEQEFNDTQDDSEIAKQLATTVFSATLSDVPEEQTPLDARRQMQLANIFAVIANERAEHTFDDSMAALQTLIDIVRMNPHLNVNGALNEYWRRHDAAP